MSDRVKRLFIAPNGGRAFYDVPKEDEYRLERVLGKGWRRATMRERIWYFLTMPRFSWLSLSAIIVLANATANLLGWR